MEPQKKKKRPQRGIQEKNNKTSQHLQTHQFWEVPAVIFWLAGANTKVEAKTLESHSAKGPPRFGPIPSGPWTIPPIFTPCSYHSTSPWDMVQVSLDQMVQQKSDEKKLKLFFTSAFHHGHHLNQLKKKKRYLDRFKKKKQQKLLVPCFFVLPGFVCKSCHAYFCCLDFLSAGSRNSFQGLRTKPGSVGILVQVVPGANRLLDPHHNTRALGKCLMDLSRPAIGSRRSSKRCQQGWLNHDPKKLMEFFPVSCFS